MKIPLTHRNIKDILEEYDIIYIKDSRKPYGYIDDKENKIYINVANQQSMRELSKTLLHEILHVLYHEKGVFHTHLQIEKEAEYYHEKTDLLDFVHSFL